MNSYTDPRARLLPAMDRRAMACLLPNGTTSNARRSPATPPDAKEQSLPPTRAACPSRSRGVFLQSQPAANKAATGRRGGRTSRGGYFGLGPFLATIAAVVIATAPFVLNGSALNANPGPEMVAAASIAPFVVHNVVR